MAASIPTIRFRGGVSCRFDDTTPLGLTLVGRTEEFPGETVHVALSGRPPADLPEVLEDVVLEKIADQCYRISTEGQAWTVEAKAMHVHQDAATAFYRAIPPRPVPWRKRVFWKVVLKLAGHPAGRRVLLSLTGR